MVRNWERGWGRGGGDHKIILEERESQNYFVEVGLPYFNESILNYPNKKIVLFDFGRLSDNLLTYL